MIHQYYRLTDWKSILFQSVSRSMQSKRWGSVRMEVRPLTVDVQFDSTWGSGYFFVAYPDNRRLLARINGKLFSIFLFRIRNTHGRSIRSMKKSTVDSRSNGSAYNKNPSLTTFLLSPWSFFFYHREKIEDYLRFLTHAGETRFPIFACGNLRKLSHFVNRLDGVLTLTI